MLSSRSGTASTPLSPLAPPPSCSPAARCATRRSSPPPTSTASPWCSRASGTSGTDPEFVSVLRARCCVPRAVLSAACLVLGAVLCAGTERRPRHLALSTAPGTWHCAPHLALGTAHRTWHAAPSTKHGWRHGTQTTQGRPVGH